MNEKEIPVNGEHGYLFLHTPEDNFVKNVLVEMCHGITGKKIKHCSQIFRQKETSQIHLRQYYRSHSHAPPPNNVTLERLMAQCNRSVTIAPNCNMETRESKIIYAENKTGEWVSKKVLLNRMKLYKSFDFRTKSSECRKI